MPETQTYQPQYEFERPPEGFSAVLDWRLGDDPYTQSLVHKLRYSPLPQEIALAEKIVRRNTDALGQITEVWGRAVLAHAEPENIMGTWYDTLEIGGFGNQPFTFINSSAGQADYSQAVATPSVDNFALTHPTVTRTHVMDEGREVELGDPFSFTGAYTRKQAARKVAANLFILNNLANRESPRFLVPLPVALGHYPTITGPDAYPAYFVVFKVPYGGKRDGRKMTWSDDADALYRYAEDTVNSLPGIAGTLAYLSNELGLTHNQPHPANVYIPKADEGHLPYLADFSTVYPLKPKKQEMARASELARGMQAAWDSVCAHFSGVNEERFIQHVFGLTLKNYLGVYVPGGPPSVDLADHFFGAALKIAVEKGVLPAKPPYLASWDKITAIEELLLRKMKKLGR